MKIFKSLSYLTLLQLSKFDYKNVNPSMIMNMLFFNINVFQNIWLCFWKMDMKALFSLPSNFAAMNSTKNFGGYDVFFVNQLEGNDTLRNKENVVQC